MATCARSRSVRVEPRRRGLAGWTQFISFLVFEPTRYVVEFADMRGLLPGPYAEYPYGISIVRRLDRRSRRSAHARTDACLFAPMPRLARPAPRSCSSCEPRRMLSLKPSTPPLNGYGSCSVCVDACPAKAASGAPWNIPRHRDEFFDAAKCRAHCRLITEERRGVSLSLCGKCLSVCPNWS